jgi:type IV pilus assembly protein PilB
MVNEHPLGELLLERGLITHEQLDEALSEQARAGRSLGRILIERGAVSSEALVATLAAQIGLEYVDLSEANIDPSAASVIPDKVARRYQALPIAWEDDRLVVAMADPSNVLAVDDIRSIAGAELKTVVSTREAIVAALERVHRLDDDAADVQAFLADDDDTEDLAQIKEITEDAPIVKLANMLIVQAVNERASDIHIEPTERDVRIRYRVDGVLHEMMRSPKRVQSGLISRLKIMSDINIAERRIPQDGRLTATVNGKPVDLRVATLPTVFGEKVVMRILDTSQALLDLADLGFLPGNHERYEAAYRKPYGAILVTGPTGSGKSTTLYATLNALNDPSKNIITVEDPVEFRLAGVNQVQVHTKAGLTFASALRSILRSDPDIVLVGEIRDRETATIAAEAALTGHLVLSTLHTNDAASTPTRLVEMGIEPFLVSSAIDCIVAQRLARRLCDRCKELYEPSEAELAGVGWEFEAHERGSLPTLYRPVGCQACARTGFLGRFAIHEVLIVSEEIERMIAEREHSEDIKKMSVAQGMLTLRQAGLMQVRNGLTSLEELLRVVA